MRETMKDRIAIVAGIRSPFCKGGGTMSDMSADDLGAYVVSQMLAQSGVKPEKIDELIFGNVLQPAQSSNIARIISVKAGIPVNVPAYTVNRNCASGLEAITSAADKIQLGHNEIVVAGGTESMSNFPVEVKKSFKDFLQKISKAKTFWQKLKTSFTLRPSDLVPDIPEIADPLCGLNMGQTAEILAREFKVTRQDQDTFALNSQKRAEKAIAEGRMSEEIVPTPIGPKYTTTQLNDEGPRAGQTIDALAKLKPAFDKLTGTVTAGNSSQITDGAAAVLLMKESKAKELGLQPIGYIRDYAAAGLQPNRMGLGPAFAISKVLQKTGLKISDIDLIEINEAFAAQVLAVLRACASDDFAKKELGRDKALGEIDLEKLNVNGGAIALGHPLGASGTRLVITLLKELKRRNKKTGIASLCIGGGQGQAIVLEVE
jgi:acetyl-CoA acyltransferase